MEKFGESLRNFRFPAAGWLILVHELLERFSFYGMKAILSIYLNEYLNISESNTTIIYHLFVAVAYFLPLVGAIISDNYLGRFKTIAIFGIVYLIGHAIMPLTALKTNIAGPLVGLVILAVGTGTIKPCVAAFGGDQIDESNTLMLDNYFSLFYAFINIGSFIAQIITPILRKDVKCINDACYPLAFGVPAIVFLITYVLFLAGKPLYKIVPNESNVLTKFCKCVTHAIGRWFRDRKTVRKPELLDYADDEYDKDFIVDSKKALSVIVLFLPFPIFWALFDQQGSRWTLQANKMNGYITSNYNFKPDQMQSLNPLLVIFAIPLFNVIIYPLLTKCNVLKSAPSRIVAGYVVAALSFVSAGLVEIAIDQTFVNIIPNNVAQLSIVNYANNPIDLTSPSFSNSINLPVRISKTISVTENDFINITADLSDSQFNYSLPVNLGRLTTAYFYEKNQVFKMKSDVIKENVEGGFTKVKIFIDFKAVVNSSIEAINLSDESKSVHLFTYKGEDQFSPEFIKLKRGSYEIVSDKNSMPKIKLEITESALTTLGIFNDSSKGFHLVKSVHLKADEIHMFWQLPQYVVMVCAEILFSVTSMSFAYSEAPSSMKALLQSAYLVTIFIGNMIVVFVEGVKSPLGLAWQFFIFAILVAIAGLINGLLAWRFLLMKRNRIMNLVEPEERKNAKSISADEDAEAYNSTSV